MPKSYYYHITILIVTFIIACYVSHYTRVHESISILQSSVEKIDYDLLNQRLPVILTTQIVNIQEVFDTIFKYQYSFIKSFTESNEWVQNKSKHMVIKPNNDVVVYVSHPKSHMKSGNYEYIHIILKQDQLLVLPYKWWVQFENCQTFQLDDVMSKIISILT